MQLGLDPSIGKQNSKDQRLINS